LRDCIKETGETMENIKMRSKHILLAVGLSLALTAVTRAANTTVYVAESASDVTYALFGAGYGGQTGSILAPFGSIQAAYHYLYTTPGDHQIRLIADENGVFSGKEIGVNEFDNGDGYIRMHGTGFPSADPSWTSVKLVSDSTRVTLSMTRDDINTPAEANHNAYPAAFEKEVVNPSGTNAANRGQVMRGLFNPGMSMALTGMIVEDLDIVLGGGHALIGTIASTGGIQQQFAFYNVNITMLSDLQDWNLDNNQNPASGSPWGRSTLFVSHMNQTDLNNSRLDFHDSNIYVQPVGINGNGFVVGQTWGSGSWYTLPDDFIYGNNTSSLYYWNGTWTPGYWNLGVWVPGYWSAGAEYVLWDDTYNIYQGGRNAGNSLTAYLLGVTGNEFLNLASFSPGEVLIPEPTSLALLGLGCLVALRRRSRKA
jgi:hypothetical protein